MPLLGQVIKQGIYLRSRLKYDRYTPEQHQKKGLRRLLRKAEHTAFGKYFDFKTILRSRNKVREFQLQVPVYNYQKIYDEWWHRSQAEEDNICWPGQVNYFALSSGTSESASKHIPITEDMIRAIKKTSINQILSMAHYKLPAGIYEKGILMLGGSTHLNRHGSYFEGDLSGISAGKIPFWFQQFYKPGRKIAKERDWETKLQEITRKAPKWDIGYIAGVPAWVQILMERIIETYKLNSIHDMWPNLSIYVHGGVSIEPYRKGFEKVFAKPLIYVDTYLASEGFIAYQDSPDAKGMKMILNDGIFFEFVPFNEKNFDSEGEITANPETFTIKDVEENVEYALLLTTCAGAWRYLIGDVIKFVSKEKSEIVIAGRTKSYLSLCGEHLSVDNMNKAIEMVANDFNISIKEYTVAGISYQGMFAHKWYIGTDDKPDTQQVKERLDYHLKQLNDDYGVERIAALKDIFIEMIPTHYFYDWHKQHHKEGGQNKFPRVMKNQRFAEWEQFIKEQSQL